MNFQSRNYIKLLLLSITLFFSSISAFVSSSIQSPSATSLGKVMSRSIIYKATTTGNSANDEEIIQKEKKIIAVIGATGAQGGSVVRALYEMNHHHQNHKHDNGDGEQIFEIRAITRDKSSPKAQAIQHLVHEIVEADCNDVDSMIQAFDKCYGAFVVTSFWPNCNMGEEMHITNVIQQAAKKTKLKHVVLSTLEDTRELIQKKYGIDPNFNHSDINTKSENEQNADLYTHWKILDEKYNSYVPHFDGKAQASNTFSAQVPTTKLITSYYYKNLLGQGGLARQIDPDQENKQQNKQEVYSFILPIGTAKLPMVAVDDIGKYAASLFQDSSTIGTTHGVASDVLTCTEIADIFTNVLGVKVIHNKAISPDVYGQFGFPGAPDLGNMYQFKQEFMEECVTIRNLSDVRKRIGLTLAFKDWVIKNKHLFDLNK